MGSKNGVGTTQSEYPQSSSGFAPSHAASTLVVHGDDNLNQTTDVAPPLHVSTTFRYASNPDELIPAKDLKAPLSTDSHVYSRHTAPTSTRLEVILTSLLQAQCITYTSGLASLHAAYCALNPQVVSMGNGYHGSTGVLQLHTKLTGAKVLPLDCPASELGEGDVIHLETPINPTGEAFEIAKYAEKAHSRGAFLIVDSTFAPPPLQDPFLWGADLVMHSGTKYLGGHSDMLCGVLATKNEEWVRVLRVERTVLGGVMGNMEGWLGVRSLRTLGLRVQRQSENAGKLVEWLERLLDEGREGSRNVQKVVEKVHHASLQQGDVSWLEKQMPNGFGSVFAATMKTERLARRLPSRSHLFNHATSLGGVESLIEWRSMSDTTVDPRLVRFSVGIEAWEDLQLDLLNAFNALAEEE